MQCPRCTAENPERAARCAFCGHGFRRRRHLEDEPLTGQREDPIASLETWIGGHGSNAGGQDRLARLMREVQSGYKRSNGQKAESRRDQEDEIFRDLVSGVFEVNRRIKRQKREMDCESLASLYTARSFSSPEAMGRVAGAIRQLLAANRRIAGEIERVLSRIRARIQDMEWTVSEKTRFWQEIANGFAAKFELRSEILEKQTTWSEATIELYEFVLCHSEQLSFEGKSVRACDRETGVEFVRRLKRAKRFRDAFRAAAARNEEIQAGLLTEWGTADSRIR